MKRLYRSLIEGIGVGIAAFFLVAVLGVAAFQNLSTTGGPTASGGIPPLSAVTHVGASTADTLSLQDYTFRNATGTNMSVTNLDFINVTTTNINTTGTLTAVGMTWTNATGTNTTTTNLGVTGGNILIPNGGKLYQDANNSVTLGGGAITLKVGGTNTFIIGAGYAYVGSLYSASAGAYSLGGNSLPFGNLYYNGFENAGYKSWNSSSITIPGGTWSQFNSVSTTNLAVSIALPSVTSTADTSSLGAMIEFKDRTGQAGTHNITITPLGSNTIDGAASAVINTNHGSLTLVSDGTNNWEIY